MELMEAMQVDPNEREQLGTLAAEHVNGDFEVPVPGNPNVVRLGSTDIYYRNDTVLAKAPTAVYEGYFMVQENKVAVKTVSNREGYTPATEIDIWLYIGREHAEKDNLNIIRLYHCKRVQSDRFITNYFAMELASGNLNEWLALQHLRSPWRMKALGFLRDVANGLKWLHKLNVIHRDITPKNVLIFHRSDSDVAKIGDFDISKYITTENAAEEYPAEGTEGWMPPETHRAKLQNQMMVVTTAQDIYSFGVTGHYTMTMGRKHPFGYSETRGYPRGTDILRDSPSHISKHEYTADHLFQWMMTRSAVVRPSIAQVINHPLFWNIEKQLQFILDVVSDIDNIDPHVTTEIDNRYIYHQGDGGFDWATRPHCIFYQNLCSSSVLRMTESYNSRSLTSLLKLIRNVYINRVEIGEEFHTDQLFGRIHNGNIIFCGKRFANFFIGMFPDVVIFLFVFLIRHPELDTLRNIRSLKEKYGLSAYANNIPAAPMYEPRL